MEGAVLLGMQACRIGGLTQVMALLSSLGNSAFIWVLIALILLIPEQRRETGVIMILALVFTSVLCIVFSNIVARPYPTDGVTGLVAVVGVSHAGYCFPSLHAAAAAAAVTVLLRSHSRGLGSVCLILGVLICLSRLYLGVNYPTDLVVGIVLGAVVAVACHAVFSRIFGLVDIGAQAKSPARKQVKTKRGRHSL